MKKLVTFSFVLIFFNQLNAEDRSKDLRILDVIDSLLQTEASWKKADVYNKCDNSLNTYSLSCAIEKAFEICGRDYAERKPVSWSLRKSIWQYNHKLYLHPLTYFNRDQKTNFQAVKTVVKMTIERLKTEKK